MPFNKAQDDAITIRREAVALLRCRGLSLRAITAALADKNITNLDTGEPYSQVTVMNDLKALNREWKKNANAAIETHRAKQLAEIDEVFREAWNRNDLKTVLDAMKQRAALLGLDAPQKREIEGDLTIKGVIDELINIDNDGVTGEDVK